MTLHINARMTGASRRVGATGDARVGLLPVTLRHPIPCSVQPMTSERRDSLRSQDIEADRVIVVSGRALAAQGLTSACAPGGVLTLESIDPEVRSRHPSGERVEIVRRTSAPSLLHDPVGNVRLDVRLSDDRAFIEVES